MYQKVDASYLSPNVNLAESLEKTCDEYNTAIIASGDFARDLSPEMFTECRLIDTVRFKGSREPVQLYTLDLQQGLLEVF